MTTPPAKTFIGRELRLELLDPGASVLTRLYKRPGGDWEAPPPEYRKLRVDPPPGQEHRYAVLYTADCIQAAAAECNILRTEPGDRCTWSKDLADQYKVARYGFEVPALFIPIDGDNRRILGLEGKQGKKYRGYEAFQHIGLELFERFGSVVHGLSWESFHRNQPGRVYALWHDHKATIKLQVESAGAATALTMDREWLAFLTENPDIEVLTP
ncbi:MAG: hypothetical protein E6R08_09000 [Nevskiaceae bacterium]|nr:MAG: hypothetical protein E6R08_09000 [Nevskiaceae bacterium]